MPGRFRGVFRDGGQSSTGRWAAGALAVLSAFGTLTSLVLWIETGVVGAAVGFATTTAAVYLAVLVLLARTVPRSRDERAGAKHAPADDTKRAVSSQR